jgi:anti-anti-sigma factor
MLDITIDREMGGAVVHLTGELDMSNADGLRHALDPFLTVPPDYLVFDLEALAFMDSSGIAVLVEMARVTPVTLRKPSRIISRVIELTGVSDLMPTEP